MVGAAGFGGVDADALAGGALDVQGLGGEGERADLGVVERLVRGLAAGDLVALPEPGEVRAFEEEFADEAGQVGCVGGGAGDGAQTGDTGGDLPVPVLEEVQPGTALLAWPGFSRSS